MGTKKEPAASATLRGWWWRGLVCTTNALDSGRDGLLQQLLVGGIETPLVDGLRSLDTVLVHVLDVLDTGFEILQSPLLVGNLQRREWAWALMMGMAP